MRLLRARTRGWEEREARRRRAGGSGVDAPGGGEGGGGSRFAAKMPPIPRKRFQNSSIDEREQNRPLASSRRIAYDPFITSHTHPVRVPVLVTIDAKFVVPCARQNMHGNLRRLQRGATSSPPVCGPRSLPRFRQGRSPQRRATTPVTPIFVAMYCVRSAGRGDCSKQHLQAALPESEKREGGGRT